MLTSKHKSYFITVTGTGTRAVPERMSCNTITTRQDGNDYAFSLAANGLNVLNNQYQKPRRRDGEGW